VVNFNPCGGYAAPEAYGVPNQGSNALYCSWLPLLEARLRHAPLPEALFLPAIWCLSADGSTEEELAMPQAAAGNLWRRRYA